MSFQPPTAEQLLRALLRAGFYIHHRRGSHATLRHNQRLTLRVTVAIHKQPLKRGTFYGILRQAEMTLEEFRQFL